ncbi:MAG: HPr family phosphocarrier protein [Candidatus Hydrogenedentales bacterium]
MFEARDELTVINRLGLHLRPAQQVVQTVLRYRSEVHFIKDGQRINAKSIMGLLTLAAARGTKIDVICEGEDADAALAAVRNLFNSGFGEEER